LLNPGQFTFVKVFACGAKQHYKADKKAALRKLSKRNQTDELYEELSRAADAMIEMQQAVDEGRDCIERLAGEMEE
jgi:hypothetical protein